MYFELMKRTIVTNLYLLKANSTLFKLSKGFLACRSKQMNTVGKLTFCFVLLVSRYLDKQVEMAKEKLQCVFSKKADTYKHYYSAWRDEEVGVSSGKDGKRRALVESRRAEEKKALSTDFYWLAISKKTSSRGPLHEPFIASSTNVQQCLVVTRGTQPVVLHLNVNKRGGKPQALPPVKVKEETRLVVSEMRDKNPMD